MKRHSSSFRSSPDSSATGPNWAEAFIRFIGQTIGNRRFGLVSAAALLLIFTLACTPMSLLATPTPLPTSAPVFQGPTPEGAATATPTPTVTPIPLPNPLPTATLLPTATPSTPWMPGEIEVYPGPLYYAGDILSVEVVVENIGQLNHDPLATMSVDGQEPLPVTPFPFYSPLRSNVLVFRWAWDTTGQTGLHQLGIVIPSEDHAGPQQLFAYVDILPASERPEQERGAAWAERATPCCRIAYITHTAAARDISILADRIDDDILAVETKIGFQVSPKPVPITLIDNVWGNGAYTAEDLVISYVDRDYVSNDLDTVVRHEATHFAMRPLEQQTPAILQEGVAVYVVGGHYKPEPIPQRAAALLALNAYIPLTDLADNFRARQHEIAYVEAGGLVYYLSETYGWGKFLALYSAKDLQGGTSQWLDQALTLTYGKGLAEIELEYKTWLRQQTPGDQVEDLRLTIDLFDTVRRYQDLYAPYEEALPTAAQAEKAGQVAEFMREPTAPENVALEAMLVQAGQDLRDGNYTSCETLIQAVSAVLDSGDFSIPPVSDYLAIARALAAQGYEAQHIDIVGSQATVQAIHTWPQIEILPLVRAGAEWKIQTEN